MPERVNRGVARVVKIGPNRRPSLKEARGGEGQVIQTI